jgi:drug/metabolite transporter (DMT)-like permease
MARAAPARARLDVTAMVVVLLLCAVWGMTQVSVKIANAGISPIMQAGLRSAGSALLLWGFSRVRGVPLFQRDGTLGHGSLIAALFAAEFVLIYWGLTYTTASRCVLFLYLSPFVVAVGAHRFVPGERLTRLKILGLACAFTGLAIAFADGLRLPTRRELVGDVMELGAAILWGAMTIVIKASRHVTLSPSKTLFYQLAGSALILLPLSAVIGEAGVTAPTAMVMGALLYQIVVVAFASYLAWYWLLSRYPASQLAVFSFFTPLFGMAAGALILSESITPALAVAMALVALGIYLVSRVPSASRLRKNAQGDQKCPDPRRANDGDGRFSSPC